MSITTPPLTNFTAGEMSPRLEGRVDISKYFNGCRVLENFLVHPHGGVIRRSGFKFVAEAGNTAEQSLLVPFEFNADQTYCLEFYETTSGAGKSRVFKDSGTVLLSGAAYEFDIPFTADEFDDLYYAQSNDMLFFCHKDHPLTTITRTGHTSWTVDNPTITGAPDAWAAGNYPQVVTFFEQRLVLAATPNEPNTIWFSRTGSFYDFRLRTREAPVEDEWDDYEVDGTHYGKDGDTFSLLDGLWFEDQFTVRGQDPNASNATAYFRYIGDLAIHANGSDLTLTFKDTVSTSVQIEAVHDGSNVFQSTYWEKFVPGERVTVDYLDPLDDDAFDLPLASRKSNAIKWIVPKAKLYVGTAGAEWTVYGSSIEAIGPGTITAELNSTSGSETTIPIEVDGGVVFLQRSGLKVREMAYRFETDSYNSKDLTILSEHITKGGLTQITRAHDPDSILYGSRADGELVAGTYEPDQDVMAWCRVVTDGDIERIAVIYDDETRVSQLWVCVKRAINGSDTRFIEYMASPFDQTSTDATDGFFVDSGLTYSGVATTTISGLDHLVGETVQILADGAVQPEREVEVGGTITLDTAASVVHVGLGYASTIEPNRLEAGSQRGVAQTKLKKITKVAVRFLATVGGKLGLAGRMDTIPFRKASDEMDQPVPCFSGDKEIVFPGGWNRDGILRIQQDQPLPMTIVLIVPTEMINE